MQLDMQQFAHDSRFESQNLRGARLGGCLGCSGGNVFELASLHSAARLVSGKWNP